jgi:hypothetical protein
MAALKRFNALPIPAAYFSEGNGPHHISSVALAVVSRDKR